MVEITESMILAIRGTTFITGKKYETMKAMAEDLEISYFSLSQICSRKRKRIGKEVLKELKKIKGFEEAMAVKELQPVKGISSKLIACVQKLTQERLKIEKGEWVYGECLSSLVKVDEQALRDFTKGKLMLSPLQLICLIVKFDASLAGFKRAHEWDKMCEAYRYELGIASFITRNFSCPKINFNISSDLGSALRLQKKSGEMAYNAPYSYVDICMSLEFGDGFYSAVSVKDSLIGGAQEFANLQKSRVTSVTAINNKKEYAAFVKENKSKRTTTLGKTFTESVYRKFYGEAELNLDDAKITFSKSSSKPDPDTVKQLIAELMKAEKIEVHSLSELMKTMTEKKIKLVLKEDFDRGPEIGTEYSVDDDGFLYERTTIRLDDLEALYERVG